MRPAGSSVRAQKTAQSVPRRPRQASVELLGTVPAVLLVAALVWQLALAGQAVWLCANAARAAARAQAGGPSPPGAPPSAPAGAPPPGGRGGRPRGGPGERPFGPPPLPP